MTENFLKIIKFKKMIFIIFVVDSYPVVVITYNIITACLQKVGAKVGCLEMGYLSI